MAGLRMTWRRGWQHITLAKAKYTASRRPVHLLYHEAFADKHEALSAEWHFKHQSRRRKELFCRRIMSSGRACQSDEKSVYFIECGMHKPH